MIEGAVFGEMPGLMGRADPKRDLRAGRQHPPPPHPLHLPRNPPREDESPKASAGS